MANERILIIDDERDVAETLQEMLRIEAYSADVATNLEEAESLLHNDLYDVAIVDLRMPETSGIDVLARCREIDPAIALLMLTAHGTVEAVTAAFKLGVKDFLTKPVRREELRFAVERALDVSRLIREARALRQKASAAPSFSAIVGNSSALRDALHLAATAATSEMSVVICGETGTGKDLVAAAIHSASHRSERPMVTSVVAAEPDQLQKSALFGHVKGAFTGAECSRKGHFQEADKSTLFLDEIAEVSLETQVALLRAIEKKRIRPVGADREISVDVRILCATNRDLLADVEAGRFREDLYHRIGGFPIRIPSLRERTEDVPLLAAHFVREFAGQNRPIPDIEPEALALLCQYDWPGNVRELRHLVERAVLLSRGETICSDHCFPSFSPTAGRRPVGYCDLPLEEASSRFVADYLEQMLAKYAGDVQKVADHAGMHVTSIRRKIRELGITRQPRGQND